MGGKENLFPLSEQTPATKTLFSLIIYLISSMLLSFVLFALGSLIFPGWAEAQIMLNSGNLSSVPPALIKYLQVGQDFTLFIIPSLIISYAVSFNITSFTGLKRKPEFSLIIVVILMMMFVMILNTFLGIINSKMSLPEHLKGIEQWMRSKEDIAEKYTIILTSGKTAFSLFSNIFIVALLPAIGEELFFRGIVQKLLSGFFKSGHAAVIITAIIFSTIHLQFFGFLPRLLLGIIFGYLFLWSGSIWLPATAHFMNNVIPVIIAWRSGWEKGNEMTEKFLSTNILPAIFSFFAVIAILYFLKKKLKETVCSEKS